MCNSSILSVDFVPIQALFFNFTLQFFWGRVRISAQKTPKQALLPVFGALSRLSAPTPKNDRKLENHVFGEFARAF